MLSWEIRGQRHTARIHDGSAETTSMAPARARTRPCGGDYFWSIHSHSFAPQLPHTFPFALLCKKRGHRQHRQPGPPDPQPQGKKRHFSKLSQVLKDKGYFILASTSSSSHVWFTFSKNNSYKLHAPSQAVHQAALKTSDSHRAPWFGAWLVFAFGVF